MTVSILVLLLWILLWTVVGLVGLLLLLLALLLFLPLDFSFRADSDLAASSWEEELTGTVRWLFRLRWGGWVLAGEWEGENLRAIRSESRICGFVRRPKPSRPSRKKKARKKEKKRTGFDLELIMAMAEEFFRFLRRAIEDLGIRIKGDLVYGFSDPSLTGWCEAIRWATGLPVPLALAPEFQRPCLTGWATASGRTFGYRLASAALKALRNPVIRHRLADHIRFWPVKRWLLRGGTP